jgi:hypothetical protein
MLKTSMMNETYERLNELDAMIAKREPSLSNVYDLLSECDEIVKNILLPENYNPSTKPVKIPFLEELLLKMQTYVPTGKIYTTVYVRPTYNTKIEYTPTKEDQEELDKLQAIMNDARQASNIWDLRHTTAIDALKKCRKNKSGVIINKESKQEYDEITSESNRLSSIFFKSRRNFDKLNDEVRLYYKGEFKGYGCDFPYDRNIIDTETFAIESGDFTVKHKHYSTIVTV